MTYTIASTTTEAGSSVTDVKVTSYTIVASDAGSVIPVDVSGGSADIQLPAAAVGLCITVEDAKGVASVTNYIKVYVPSAGVKINGVANAKVTLTLPNSSITLVSNGLDWYVIGGLIWAGTIVANV